MLRIKKNPFQASAPSAQSPRMHQRRITRHHSTLQHQQQLLVLLQLLQLLLQQQLRQLLGLIIHCEKLAVRLLVR